MTQQGTSAWLTASERLGIRLDDNAKLQLARYRDLLLEWSQRFNLTAITEPAEVERLLLLDSLTILCATAASGVPLIPDGALLIDVGTGAGIPGIPIAIARPAVRVLMLESVAKKARFVELAIRELGLTNAEIRCARSEEAAHDPALRGQAAVVTARAVAKLATLAELALPFLRVGGHAVLPKQQPIEAELRDGARAVQLLGGRLRPLIHVDDPMLPPGRVLVVVEKVTETPAQYPRRPGMPAKRPL